MVKSVNIEKIIINVLNSTLSLCGFIFQRVHIFNKFKIFHVKQLVVNSLVMSKMV